MDNCISVIIITFNEERNIARCIESVKSIADEIIVVDSFSTDNTKTIADSLGAIVLDHEFEGHIQQKNWAKSQASHEFVLSLDADEAISPELAREILTEKQNKFPFAAYTMPRLNFVGEQAIKGCGWYPDRKLRLWKGIDGNWVGVNPHDRLKMNMGYDQKKLTGDLLHYSYANRKEILKKSKGYGRIGAKSTKSYDWGMLIYKFLFSPITKFIRNYFIKKGFLYGYTGLIICVGQFVETQTKYYQGIKLKLRW